MQTADKLLSDSRSFLPEKAVSSTSSDRWRRLGTSAWLKNCSNSPDDYIKSKLAVPDGSLKSKPTC